MLFHARGPQILNDVPETHPLHGIDLRTLDDVRLAEAAAHALAPALERVFSHSDLKQPDHRKIADLASSIFRRVSRIIVWWARLEHLSGDKTFKVVNLDEMLEATILAYIHMV